MHKDAEFVPLNIAILTLSDSRTFETDTSGQALEDALKAAGHKLAARKICKDEIYQSRAIVSQWIADEGIDVIISTGGTGLTQRDSTPEALKPLFDQNIEGFGELFRHLSWQEIGTSTVQSRAVAGLANQTLVFCLPGSTGACKDAWTQLISTQLDYRTRPCNLVELMPRLRE